MKNRVRSLRVRNFLRIWKLIDKYFKNHPYRDNEADFDDVLAFVMNESQGMLHPKLVIAELEKIKVDGI